MPRRAHRLDANQDAIVDALCAAPDVSVFSLAGRGGGLSGSPRGDHGRDASGRSERRGEATLTSGTDAGAAAVAGTVARYAGRDAHGRRRRRGRGLSNTERTGETHDRTGTTGH